MMFRKRLAVTGALALATALPAPINALACGTNSAASSGSAGASPFGLTDGHMALYVGVAALLFLMAQLAIPLVVTMRRKQTSLLGGVQVSPDGRYWWDGFAWRPVPEPNRPV
jgi:hypothetical protein